MQKEDKFEMNSVPFVLFGTIMLFTSWLFFNGGSSLSMFKPRSNNAPKIMMCTILSATTGGFVSSFLKPLIMGTYSAQNRYDLGALTNGLLSGLVSITGVSDRCEPWSAFLIGVVASVVYSFACKGMQKAGIDDPVEASMVHGACGMWGLLAVGLFDN